MVIRYATRGKPWGNEARVAFSLETLRDQLNAVTPRRSKASDGFIGDLAHQASKSEHNPNPAGVILAGDFTHDPADGLDCNKLVADLVESRDPRIRYIIWNRRIVSSYPVGGVPAWTWRRYKGKNGHTKHAHVSVDAARSLYDQTRRWVLRRLEGVVGRPSPAKPVAPKPGQLVPMGAFVPKGRRALNRADDGGRELEAVGKIQANLKAHGHYKGALDKLFGPATEQAVRSFQRSRRLEVDGRVGPTTWRELGETS